MFRHVRNAAIAALLWSLASSLVWADSWRLAGLSLLTGEATAESSSPELEVLDSEATLPPGTYVDLDSYMSGDPLTSDFAPTWTWQCLPSGLVYKNYLAGVKESRLSTLYAYEKDLGWVWDSTLGQRAGLVRFGTDNPFYPEGIQLDVEGSAQLRMDPQEDRDVWAVDYRAGVPVSFGVGPQQIKFGYYHISSHLGDEFLLKNPGFDRLNFVRDVLILGYSRYLTERLRVYGEVGWAFYADISEPWEFMAGVDYAPLFATGSRGAPFFALNAHVRQELDYSGNFTAQAGWAWRSGTNGRLLRAGFHYLNGASNEYSFYQTHEGQIGIGLWLDN